MERPAHTRNLPNLCDEVLSHACVRVAKFVTMMMGLGLVWKVSRLTPSPESPLRAPAPVSGTGGGMGGWSRGWGALGKHWGLTRCCNGWPQTTTELAEKGNSKIARACLKIEPQLKLEGPSFTNSTRADTSNSEKQINR